MSKKNQLAVIIALLTTLSVLVTLVSTLYLRNKIVENLIASETRHNLVVTKQTAGLLEKEIKTIWDKVSLVTQFPQIQDGDTETCNKKLKELEPLIEAQVGNITRFNTKLTLDCAINKKAIGYVLTPDSPITAVIKNPKHEADLSYSGFSPITNQEVLYLNLPVFTSKGTYSGIIGGVIYLQYIGDKYLKDIAPGEGSYFTLIDDNGGYLYHPDKKLIGKNYASPEVGNSSALLDLDKMALDDSKNNKSGTLRYTVLNKERIGIYAPASVFPNRKWTLILNVPVETITAKANEAKGGGINFFVTISAVIIFIFISFSALVLLFIIRGLFNPITQIKNATDKIGEGDMDVKMNSGLLSAKDEFGQLARSVKKMATDLKQSRVGLEKKVKERTKELEKTKSELELRAKELEKSNKFLVGRELKMVELKKENESLKKERKSE